MKLPAVEADSLLNKAKANRFALWRTFDFIGVQALHSVIEGRITQAEADSHLQMLRKMAFDGASMQDVHAHMKRHNLLSESEDIDFSYYTGDFSLKQGIRSPDSTRRGS